MITGTAVMIGSLARSMPMVLAEKAALTIAGYKAGLLRAVTVDPQGRVCVEAPTEAAEADLLGCYRNARKGAWVEMAAQIERDLVHECRERGISVRRAA